MEKSAQSVNYTADGIEPDKMTEFIVETWLPYLQYQKVSEKISYGKI